MADASRSTAHEDRLSTGNTGSLQPLGGRDGHEREGCRFSSRERLRAFREQPCLGNFARRYPKVTLDLVLSDQVLHVVAGAYDLIVRNTELTDGTLIHARASHEFNDGEAMRLSIEAGMGIGVKSAWNVKKALQTGTLIEVLPDHPLLTKTAIWALYPAERLPPPESSGD